MTCFKIAAFAGAASLAAAPAAAAAPSAAAPLAISAESIAASLLASDDGSAAAPSASASASSVVPAVAASAQLPSQTPVIWRGSAQRAFGNGTPESQITAYGGFYNASNGYADRYVAGSFMDLQLGATGLHTDVLYVNREQNAAYGAIGISQQIEGLGRIKFMAGTSSNGQDVVPRLFLSAGFDLNPAKQLIIRPTVAYRKFDNGRSQIDPSLQLAYYFGGGTRGYWVGQADGGLFINNVGGTGWGIGGGLTRVNGNGWRFGAALHGGYMTYDAITGTNVHSYTVGGGPNIGYRFANHTEIFLRSDLTATRFYTVTGAIVGLKLAL